MTEEKPERVAFEFKHGEAEHHEVDFDHPTEANCYPLVKDVHALIRRSDAREHYGGETFSIGHWIDIGEYRERQRMREMLEDVGRIDPTNPASLPKNLDVNSPSEAYGAKEMLEYLKQKLKSEDEAREDE